MMNEAANQRAPMLSNVRHIKFDRASLNTPTGLLHLYFRPAIKKTIDEYHTWASEI